jgi:Zn finger protein HypA/HybF involved in hydrogenase expression
MATSKGTTVPGYRNKNGQLTVRATGLQGTDHLQKIYVLRCENCNHEYGANGSDIFQRRCPQCGNGRPGLDCSHTV